MNRFYKPTPREYVSSQVDVPWEFLQGVADKKQGEYDKADAGVDAAAKLLDFENIPGDTPWKREKQKYYNDMLLQVRDHLHNSGDISGASRALTGVVREIAEDRDIAIMKAAVEPYKEQYKTWEKMKGEDKFLQPWQEKFDPMHSTRDKQTGKFNPYNQTVGYEAPDHHKNLNESFGTLHIDDVTQGGYFIDKDGMKTTAVTGGGKIDSKRIEQRAQESLVNYRGTTSYKDHKEQAKAEGYTGEEVTKRADEISIAKLYHHGLDQIRTVWKNVQDIHDMGDAYRKKFAVNNNPYVPLEAKDLFANADDDDFNEQMGTHLEGSYMGPMVGGSQTTVYSSEGYKTFDQLKKENKEIALKYFESKGEGYDALKKKYLDGRANTKELEIINSSIKSYRNQFYKAAKQNLLGRTMGDVGDVAYEYTGVNAGQDGQFPASVLKSGAGFLTGQTKLYNEADGKPLLLKDLKIDEGDQALVNKEYSPTSPYYTLSGGDEKFAAPRQLVIMDSKGTVKGRYALPAVDTNGDYNRSMVAIAKNATALYTPNVFTQSHDSDFKIKYAAVNPTTNVPLSNDEIDALRNGGLAIPATYDIYDKDRNLIAKTYSPEEATLEIAKLREAANKKPKKK